MNKMKVLPFLVMLSLLLVGGVSVFAYKGDLAKTGPNYTPERHETMQKAFENNDYEAWKSLMEGTNKNKRVLQIINKDNFSKFAEAHKLMLEGKFDEANKIKTELGLGIHGKGFGCGNRMK